MTELEKKADNYAYEVYSTRPLGDDPTDDEIKEAYIQGYKDAMTWHYPSRGEIPDKDWSKHPLNVSEECFVVTKRGVGTIAWWDNDYRTWFEKPRLPVLEVIAWQYFIPPRKEYTY